MPMPNDGGSRGSGQHRTAATMWYATTVTISSASFGTDEIDKANRSIRVGADIVRELRGQGYGRKVYRLLKKYCFDYLNMHRVWLAVLDTNEAGRRLYESEGFEVEGRYREAIFRDGKYHDYILMSILEQQYRRGFG